MLSINVELTAGCHIREAFKDAIDLANKLNCYVCFDFNDIKCIANPGTSADSAVEKYYRVIKDKSIKYKFVFS